MVNEIVLNGFTIRLQQVPECPLCGRSSYPHGMTPVFGIPRNNHVYIVMKHSRCGEVLVATYSIDFDFVAGGYVGKLLSGLPAHYFEPAKFEPPIPAVSKDFCAIYNEAKQVEESDLLRICGAGYRKALEFLIKDYLIRHKFAGDGKAAKAIEGATIASCIDRYIDDEGIQNAAKRAAWLGNDGTHYARKLTDKDVADLKDLIGITVGWIAHNVRLLRTPTVDAG